MTADAVGGVWTYATQLARALASRGVEVVIATMGPPPNEQQRRLLGSAAKLEVSRYALEWMDDAARDVEHATTWLAQLDATYVPDLIHVNGYAHGALPTRTPRIVVAHSCVGSWFQAVKGQALPSRYAAYRAHLVAGLAAASAVVAPTAAMLWQLQAAYDVSLEQRAVVIPNGIALDACVPGDKEHLVAAVGRVWDDAKNIAALCAIAGNIEWRVVVAGPTSRDEQTMLESGPVRFTGYLPHDQVRQLLGRTAILVHPARYEPFGLVPLEAAACGCALVLGDIPSLHEVWGNAAVYVLPDDRAALSTAIRRLIRDPEWRREMAWRARERAQHYTLTTMVERYMALYARVLAARQKEVACASSSSRTRSSRTGITETLTSCAESSPSSSPEAMTSAASSLATHGV
jgi:glycosyltransferase involved in cell wall biosynthesis